MNNNYVLTENIQKNNEKMISLKAGEVVTLKIDMQ